ncbi:hypothetical protein [Streptomyces sp. NPDC059008]|uniref:hypothetical protein n=1 Tax=Streptomyces sp. NPDC059008 TaxID=3346693 RepID=UPI00369639D0
MSERGGKGRGGARSSAADELVAKVLGSVRYAPDGARAEDAIEAGASMLAAAEPGWEAVSAAVVEAAVAGVRQCWAGGWHPADLERIVRREAADATLVALVVDAVAAEHARPAATRHRPGTRWSEQLQQLGAEVWWESDRGYLDAVAARRRTSRFETAYDVLAALRVLARLPSPRCRPRRRPGPGPGPRRGAAPGTPHRAPSGASAACSPRPRRRTTRRRRRRCPPRRRS